MKADSVAALALTSLSLYRIDECEAINNPDGPEGEGERAAPVGPNRLLLVLLL